MSFFLPLIILPLVVKQDYYVHNVNTLLLFYCRNELEIILVQKCSENQEESNCQMSGTNATS